ncbi:hypothetical protein M513_13631 [Trichuris suis]|uniref:Peptidase A2 domain-containing protein n=1 Tax=Trichuris suis TaxID=68888 RepID=A0A085LKJ6_9BILA|nr:hypothetical protein M513_13631 [Trichuris suis]
MQKLWESAHKTVHSLHEQHSVERGKIFVTVTVQYGLLLDPVKFLLGTGSSVSILSESLFLLHSASVRLEPTSKQVRTYCGNPLRVLGCFPVEIVYKEKRKIANLFVCTSETSLLGMDVIDSLKIGIQGSQLDAPIATRPDLPDVIVKLENNCSKK